ncbi:ankyrin repeat-containing domain protein [Lophiotrema nucula]|uniref:Ankyrin repeat-containing domain protein n=1 Tax=Lophiotrema nucula TaxID=690887 RepID=A0A6A5Z007_9PLEO|nr:ankyrin repeat-containing domain protein [Lophiotrema nucula]
MPHNGFLPCFPLEIWRLVLVEAVCCRGLKRALRLRLVNKLFSAEVIEALSTCQMMDDVQLGIGHCPLMSTYFERRALSERMDNPGFTAIQHIAHLMSSQAGSCTREKLSYRHYANALFRLACRVLPSNAPQWYFRPIISRSKRDNNNDTLAAAAGLNKLDLVKELVGQRFEITCYAPLFERALIAAAVMGNYEVLEYLLSQLDLTKDHCQFLMLAHTSTRGSPDTVRFILDKMRPHFDLTHQPRSRDMNLLEKCLATQHIESFEMVMEERNNSKDSTIPLKEELLYELLAGAAGEGWTAMIAFLLELGASPHIPQRTLERNERSRLRSKVPRKRETPSVIHRACEAGSSRAAAMLLAHGASLQGEAELCIAASKGHIETVRLLLDRGVEPRECLGVAAGKGFLDIVKLLLERGADPNTGSPLPIVKAIDAEHAGVYKTLLDYGAVVDLSELGRAARQAHQRRIQLGIW